MQCYYIAHSSSGQTNQNHHCHGRRLVTVTVVAFATDNVSISNAVSMCHCLPADNQAHSIESCSTLLNSRHRHFSVEFTFAVPVAAASRHAHTINEVVKDAFTDTRTLHHHCTTR